MDWTVDRLKPRGEQAFDLIVGLVDRAHAPGFLVALAAELHRGFGERDFRLHKRPLLCCRDCRTTADF